MQTRGWISPIEMRAIRFKSIKTYNGSDSNYKGLIETSKSEVVNKKNINQARTSNDEIGLILNRPIFING